MKYELKWNVFYHDINKQKITTLNIFEHGGFYNDVQKSLKKFKDKDEFAEELRRDLFYYFGSKCEYEVLISAWCGGNGKEDIKVDIYTQVRNNWEVFVDYCWNSKIHRPRKKKDAVCKTTNLPCSYCQPVCNSREDVASN